MSLSTRPAKRWSFLKRAIYRLAAAIIPRLFRILIHLEVNHIEMTNTFPEGKPVIFCGNHRSHLDTFVVASAIIEPYGRRRYLALMASGKAMQQNFLFGLTRLVGAFPVFSEKPNSAFNYAVRSLREGFAVFIAPQGKRIDKTPFHDYFNLVREGRTGVGRIILAMNGKVPVVPLFIHGTAEAWSPGNIAPKFGSHVSVSFGEPLYFHQYTRPDGWTEQTPDFYIKAREIVDKIMDGIRDQLIDCEKHYFQFLEWKFKTKIDKITISPGEEWKFNQLLRKLARVHPKRLQEFLQSKSYF